MATIRLSQDVAYVVETIWLLSSSYIISSTKLVINYKFFQGKWYLHKLCWHPSCRWMDGQMDERMREFDVILAQRRANRHRNQHCDQVKCTYSPGWNSPPMYELMVSGRCRDQARTHLLAATTEVTDLEPFFTRIRKQRHCRCWKQKQRMISMLSSSRK